MRFSCGRWLMTAVSCSVLGVITAPLAAQAPRASPVVRTAFASDRSDAAPAAPDKPMPKDQPPEELPPPRKPSVATVPVTAPQSLGMPDLIRMTVERNPRLAQAGFAVDAARGRALQAGLYPNPVVYYSGDELGDRTGPAGIHTPLLSQEIVTAGKLKLDRAAALREVDQAVLAVLAERYGRFAAVRQSYFEVLTLQRRLAILAQLIKLAEQSVDTTKKLLEAKQVARLDLVQLEIEVERFRADQDATTREVPAAFRRLAAAVGLPNLPYADLVGTLESAAPDYDLDQARLFVLEAHPEVRSAQVGVNRARLLLQRAQVEPVPNVTVGAGYVYQGQNRSNDASVAVSFPVPVWNKNQGNIAAARADVAEAQARVGRVQTDLAERLAVAYGPYASARQRAERYRAAIIPRAQETFDLSMKAFQGGQFEYLRVLQAQRAVAEANLEYNRSLGEMWRAAAEISGLLLEEGWPCPPAAPPTPPQNPPQATPR